MDTLEGQALHRTARFYLYILKCWLVEMPFVGWVIANVLRVVIPVVVIFASGLINCVNWMLPARSKQDFTSLVLHMVWAVFPKRIRARCFQVAGELCEARYELVGDMDALDNAISFHGMALPMRPSGHPQRFTSLSLLANSLSTRYTRLGGLGDLSRAIALHTEALDICPAGHPNRSTSLFNLASALIRRFERHKDVADLQRAITLFTEILTLFPLGHPNHLGSLNNLAHTVMLRYERLGALSDLQRVITLFTEALTLSPSGHADRSTSLNNLAHTVTLRYERLGALSDLQRAITLHTEALGLRPVGHPDRSRSLNNLANVVMMYYQRQGDVSDLQRAITLHTEALGLRPSGHPDRSESLNSLATAIVRRYQRRGDLTDLQRAIALYTEALGLRPAGHPDRSSSLNNLASTVMARYERQGDVGDLQRAITLFTETLPLFPPGHHNRLLSLNNLAGAVTTRYELQRDVGDLQHAITLFTEVITLLPAGHPNRSASLSNLAYAVIRLFERHEDIGNLQCAITLFTEALTLCPSGHADRSTSLNNLAGAVMMRYERQGNVSDLQRAITLHTETLTFFPSGHPKRSDSLYNLAVAVMTRYERQRDVGDLQRAITLFTEVITLFPSGHPNRSDALRTLAKALVRRYERQQRPDDLRDAISFMQEATQTPGAPWHSALRAAHLWMRSAHKYSDNSLPEACRESVHLLQKVVIGAPAALNKRHQFATEVAQLNVVSFAVSCAIDRGVLDLAVELMEQGRTLLWSSLRGLRSPVDELALKHPELAKKLEKLNSALESSTYSHTGVVRPTASWMTAEVAARITREQAKQRDALIEDIRTREGFTDFLRAVPYARLLDAAANGPVVLFNIRESQSEAVVLHRRDSILVPLPALHPAALKKLIKDLASARGASSDRISNRLFKEHLQELWNLVVEPVTSRLRELGVAEGSRIWWCPMSTLVRLPLHAAAPRSAMRAVMPSFYVSSYTPALTALLDARSRRSMVQKFDNPSCVRRPLFVGQPLAPGAPKVYLKEREEIQRHTSPIDSVLDDEATPARVLDEIRRHPWVHLSCHGIHEPDNPLESHFLLHDDAHLTLSKIAAAHLPRSELIYLAACHGARDYTSTPDEALHLAAAMQFAGFDSVVASLWEVDDGDAPLMAGAFWEHMFRNGPENVDASEAAEALNVAILTLRRTKKDFPYHRWVNLVHIGV